MRVLHFADMHLDTAFAWMGGDRGAARRRRQAQRAVLGDIVDLAVREDVDALLCGGDLFEQERFTADTVHFLCEVFERAHPLRVFIAPGNHDWHGPQSLYRQVDWSPNVHVFTGNRLEPVELEDGVTLWGAAHRAPSGTRGFLEEFEVDRGGVHLALFHGALVDAVPGGCDAETSHAPFRAADVERSGLHHAFVGHYHRPRADELLTYPGNPEPLAFGEDGQRGAVLADIGERGEIERDWRHVARTEAHDLTLRVDGHAHVDSLRAAVESALAGTRGVARVRLEGELEASLHLRPGDLDDVAADLECVKIELGELHAAFDLEALATEPTVRGQFVRDVRSSDLPVDERRRVLLIGLRALDGRADLEGV